MDTLTLASGLVFHDPKQRLLRFCRDEYEYYDAIPKGDPNRIEPLDILATVALNSRVDTALKVRTVHRGMSAACDRALEAIPIQSDLLSFDSIDRLHQLFAAAMTSKYVLLATATKVLHRKRPELIPVLDSVVVAHYVHSPEEKNLLQRSWSSRSAAAQIGRIAIERLKDDLASGAEPIRELRGVLEREGFQLTPVRILDILIWTERETTGYYTRALH